MNKPLLRILPLTAALGLASAASAQTTGSVGIGTTTPHASALLDLTSLTKGVLVPRMTSVERANISSPAAGLLVYQTNGVQLGFWYYTGAAWTYLNPAPAGDNLGNHTATQNLNLADKLLVGNGGSSGLAISSGGNVGIGTSSPRGRLDVGSGDTYLVADVNNGSTQSVYLPGHLFLAPFSGGSGTAYLQARVPNPNSSTSIGLTLRTTSAGNLLDAVNLAPGGNVGVGAASPSQKLEVAGQVYSSSGGFRFPDNTVQTTAATAPAPQTLTLTGQTLGISGGNTVSLPVGADNLGNHTATQNLNLADKLLVGNGGSAGLSISGTGQVGVGTASPAASAVLDLQSAANNKGLLAPRLTASQRAAISSPATGLLVYQTDATLGFYYFDGLNWLHLPSGRTPDAQGNVPTGTAAQFGAAQSTILAGGEGITGYQDAVGTAARFNGSRGGAVDANGNVYVADQGNHCIRKILPNGTVTTLAGSAFAVGSANGVGAAARFNSPSDVAVDASGNVYVADAGNNRIRKILPDGTVSTLAGSSAGYQDGAGTAAQFNGPYGVDVDAAGVVYVAEGSGNRIRKIQPNGTVSTLAGSPAGTTGSANGVGTAAQFSSPDDVAVDAAGVVYVAEFIGQSVRKILPNGTVSTLVGSVGGNATGVAVDGAGVVYAGVYGASRVLAIQPDGSSAFFGNVGSQFNNSFRLDVDATGTLYVADGRNSVVRKLARPLVTNAVAAIGNQQLSISGATISLTNGGSVTVPASTDNLGNHTATQNLNLGNNQLVGNGGSSGLRIASDGNVGIGASTPVAPLEVVRDNGSAYLLLHDPNDHFFSFGQDRGAGNNIKISDGNGFGGNNFLTIQRTNGNLGIGTSSPGQKLDVAGNAQLSGGLVVDNANTNNGVIGAGSGAVFGGALSGEGIASNRSASNGNQYGLDFYTSFTKRLSISNAGYVGIGTTGPAFPLDVQGSVTPGNFAYGFLNGSGSVGSTGSNTGPVSIRASGRVVATEFNATSDRRLKTIVGLSNPAADLALLRRLRITDYTMRDRVQFGTRPFKKVIAQEVEEVFPQAVSQHAGFLPDVYAVAASAQSAGDSLLRLTLPAALPTAAKAGQRVKLIGPAGEVIGTVAQAAGGKELLVRGAPQLAGQQVFVFGLEHADVRSVDYEALSMLNVSATQELARQVAELQKQNAALRAQTAAQSQQLTQQQTTLSGQQAALQTWQAQAAAQHAELAQRLKALENLLGAKAEAK